MTKSFRRLFVFAAGLLIADPILPIAGRADQPSPAQLKLLQLDLRDAVKPTWGFQGQLQGAGTPNAYGIGAFLPLAYGRNSVTFLDLLANYNLADRRNNSSIAAADLFGGTISTSTRLGHRWLNNSRSWLYGVNAGYDTRPLTINAPAGASGSSSGFFQQVAVGAEAINKDFRFNATALIPVGNTRQALTNAYEATTLGSINLDASYALSAGLDASLGYYYQWGDWVEASGSGVKGRLAYAINNGLTAGINISYDNAFETRISGDITYRFNTPKSTVASVGRNDLIASLSSPLPNRDVRVLGRSLVQAQTSTLLACNPSNYGPTLSLTSWDTSTGTYVPADPTAIPTPTSAYYSFTNGSNLYEVAINRWQCGPS